MTGDNPACLPSPDPSCPSTGSGRRAILGGAAALSVLALPRMAAARAAQAAEPSLDIVTLLVAGPAGGRLASWGELLARVIGRDLPPGTAIRRQIAGGADGVTGANQFEARFAPDGDTLLLLPGEAPLAWLAGDPRARFDAARWIPVITGLTPGIVATRVPLEALRPGARLRIAAGRGPADMQLAALLGIDLLGLEVVPVYGLGDPATARAALAAHTVDAVFVTGADVPGELDALATIGVRPLFSFGFPDASGRLARDPMMPGTPSLPELAQHMRGSNLGGALYCAWRAAAAAAQMQFALVLPQLTPAALVALWHKAGADAAVSAEMLAATADGVRPVVVAADAAGVPDSAALLELRGWMSSRFGWQPA